MAVLTPNSYSTDRFTYVPAERMFVAEASDLDRPEPFGRVYDDACDEGLTLVSARTGTRVVFAVDHVQRDREGELMYWDLTPAPYLRAGRADLSGVRVRVYND